MLSGPKANPGMRRHVSKVQAHGTHTHTHLFRCRGWPHILYLLWPKCRGMRGLLDLSSNMPCHSYQYIGFPAAEPTISVRSLSYFYQANCLITHLCLSCAAAQSYLYQTIRSNVQQLYSRDHNNFLAAMINISNVLLLQCEIYIYIYITD